jgi:hypothetical protein
MLKNQVTEPVTPQGFISREQVLARLWEIARLSPEITRNSITGQIKALAMIVSIEGLIPDRAKKHLPPQPLKPSPDPVPDQRKRAVPEYNFDYLSEKLLASALDPTAVFSTKKDEPYIRRN